jgi:predicted small lipoprotein YifL
MKLRLAIAVLAALALAGCGVKSDLEKPSAQTEKNEKDPSKPPSQLGK